MSLSLTLALTLALVRRLQQVFGVAGAAKLEQIQQIGSPL